MAKGYNKNRNLPKGQPMQRKVLGDFFRREELDRLILSLKPGEGIAVQEGQVYRFTIGGKHGTGR